MSPTSYRTALPRFIRPKRFAPTAKIIIARFAAPVNPCGKNFPIHYKRRGGQPARRAMAAPRRSLPPAARKKRGIRARTALEMPAKPLRCKTGSRSHPPALPALHAKGAAALRQPRPRALTKPTTAKIALIYKKSEAILGLYNKSWGKEQKSGQSKPNQVKWKCKNPQPEEGILCPRKIIAQNS